MGDVNIVFALVHLCPLCLSLCDILTLLSVIPVFKDTVGIIFHMSPKGKLLHSGLSQEVGICSITGRKTRWERLGRWPHMHFMAYLGNCQ